MRPKDWIYGVVILGALFFAAGYCIYLFWRLDFKVFVDAFLLAISLMLITFGLLILSPYKIRRQILIISHSLSLNRFFIWMPDYDDTLNSFTSSKSKVWAGFMVFTGILLLILKILIL